MVEVNATYKHSQYEQISLKSLCVMSNIKDFATQMTDYIDPYVTHMD